MGTFNTYGKKSKVYGGSNPVWLSIRQKERSGGTLDPIPPVGSIIPAGTLVNIDGAGGKATLIKSFYVKNYDSENQTIVLRGLKNDIRPTVGMILMYPPDNLIFTIRQEQIFTCTVEEVEYLADSQEYKIKIEGGISYLTEGSSLIEGKYFEGKGYSTLALPTGLTENDVWIEEGDEHATVASVFDGEIMEDRIQPIPQCVKNLLPQIKFVKGV